MAYKIAQESANSAHLIRAGKIKGQGGKLEAFSRDTTYIPYGSLPIQAKALIEMIVPATILLDHVVQVSHSELTITGSKILSPHRARRPEAILMRPIMCVGI